MPQHDHQWISPRLRILQEEIARENTSALATFWQEMAELGTPLFESLPNESDHCLVTFVWRGDEQTRNVVLVGSLPAYMDGFLFAERQMEHLEGTDLWFRTYRVRNTLHTAYQFSPNDPLNEPEEIADWLARFANFCPDPLNPLQLVSPRDEEAPNSYSGVSSIARGSAAAPRWSAGGEAGPQGTMTQHRLRSAILQNERRIWLYTPPAYDEARTHPYPLLLLFDGFDYMNTISPPAMLDALIEAGHVPPLVAAYIDNLGQQVRNRELPCYQPFSDFLVQELVPWLRHHYHVTHEPQGTVIAGSSYGGLAAAFAGLQAPDIFGNVLAQSGSFGWHPEEDPDEGWLIQQYAQAPRLPLRFALEEGLWEWPGQVAAIRQMRDVLQDKGYQVFYHQQYGGHDELTWQDHFPLALRKLFMQ